MTTTRIVIYAIWFSLPLFFFTIGFWGWLEEVSGRRTKHANAADYFKQGFFVLGCVLVAVLIDQYVLETIVEMISPEWLPLGFFEVILLPFILYLAAKFAGPTKAIKVTYRRTPKPKDQS